MQLHRRHFRKFGCICRFMFFRHRPQKTRIMHPSHQWWLSMHIAVEKQPLLDNQPHVTITATTPFLLISMPVWHCPLIILQGGCSKIIWSHPWCQQKMCLRTWLPHSPQPSQMQQPTHLISSLNSLWTMRQCWHGKKYSEISKKICILIFLIATITNSLSGSSMDILGNLCLSLTLSPCNGCKCKNAKYHGAILQWMKKVGSNVIYVFILKFISQNRNHHGAPCHLA